MRQQLCEQRRASPKVIVAVLCFVGSLSSPKQAIGSGCLVKDLPQGWRIFVEQSQKFCFAYPPQYRSITPAAEPHRWSSHAVEIVQLRSREARQANAGDHEEAAIEIWYSKVKFDLRQLALQAPTGLITPPSPKRAGNNQFYFYGPGGGGVAYPDRYYFNLRGNTLEVDFDGPYNGHEKSPVPDTSAIAFPLLATLRTF